MPPLSEGEKAIIREIAFEAAGVIKDELAEHFKTGIRLHQAECPATKAAARWPKQIWFLVIGIAVGSSGGVVGLLKLLRVF